MSAKKGLLFLAVLSVLVISCSKELENSSKKQNDVPSLNKKRPGKPGDNPPPPPPPPPPPVGITVLTGKWRNASYDHPQAPTCRTDDTYQFNTNGTYVSNPNIKCSDLEYLFNGSYTINGNIVRMSGIVNDLTLTVVDANTIKLSAYTIADDIEVLLFQLVLKKI